MNAQTAEPTTAAVDAGSTSVRETAIVIRFPPMGWCVRPGIWKAHFFRRERGRTRTVSACDTVERFDEYVPQRFRPLQAHKPRCSLCEAALRREKTAPQLGTLNEQRVTSKRVDGQEGIECK